VEDNATGVVEYANVVNVMKDNFVRQLLSTVRLHVVGVLC
jgi:hypothetical protein